MLGSIIAAILIIAGYFENNLWVIGFGSVLAAFGVRGSVLNYNKMGALVNFVLVLIGAFVIWLDNPPSTAPQHTNQAVSTPRVNTVPNRPQVVINREIEPKAAEPEKAKRDFEISAKLKLKCWGNTKQPLKVDHPDSYLELKFCADSDPVEVYILYTKKEVRFNYSLSSNKDIEYDAKIGGIGGYTINGVLISELVKSEYKTSATGTTILILRPIARGFKKAGLNSIFLGIMSY